MSIRDVGVTREDVLFIVGFLAGAKSDPVLLALVANLAQRFTPAAPEGDAPEGYTRDGAPPGLMRRIAPDANPGLFVPGLAE